jgi:hypothetical protein
MQFKADNFLIHWFSLKLKSEIKKRTLLQHESARWKLMEVHQLPRIGGRWPCATAAPS